MRQYIGLVASLRHRRTLPSYNDARMTFPDLRSRRVILVAHCVLNQNAKIDGCARYPGAMRELLHCLVEWGIGIVQMPCPELIHLGLDRRADVAATRTIGSEDTRVADLMNEPAAASACARLAGELAYQVEEYLRNGFEVIGILGINGSPTCGVEAGWRDGKECPGPGAFIRQVEDRLLSRGISIPARGVRADDAAGAVFAGAGLARIEPRPAIGP